MSSLKIEKWKLGADQSQSWQENIVCMKSFLIQFYEDYGWSFEYFSEPSRIHLDAAAVLYNRMRNWHTTQSSWFHVLRFMNFWKNYNECKFQY